MVGSLQKEERAGHFGAGSGLTIVGLVLPCTGTDTHRYANEQLSVHCGDSRPVETSLPEDTVFMRH